jgi:hypothetical protein
MMQPRRIDRSAGTTDGFIPRAAAAVSRSAAKNVQETILSFAPSPETRPCTTEVIF